ncbi:MAG: HutP family protein, partial [Synergistetes bacterium]|nr:HutP family protein [Synergistota bacterium]
VPLSNSLLLKVAVVSDGRWIAVCMFGESAFHVLTNHRRIGLGVMHLGD